MFDKYDLMYGINRSNKRKLKYITYTSLFIVTLECVLTNELKLFFGWPGDAKESLQFICTAYLLGLAAVFIKVYISSLRSIKKFQSKKNTLLIDEHKSLSAEQFEMIRRKATVRAEILNILHMENLSKKKMKKLKKIKKSVGDKREISAKAEYLNAIKSKAHSEISLSKKEIQYLNELVLSEKDLELYRNISKIFNIQKTS